VIPMLSAYNRRYLRATWTEKKDEERKRRRSRAWEDMTSPGRAAPSNAQDASSASCDSLLFSPPLTRPLYNPDHLHACQAAHNEKLPVRRPLRPAFPSPFSCRNPSRTTRPFGVCRKWGHQAQHRDIRLANISQTHLVRIDSTYRAGHETSVWPLQVRPLIHEQHKSNF
jgi:hypothetical protein